MKNVKISSINVIDIVKSSSGPRYVVGVKPKLDTEKLKVGILYICFKIIRS